MYASLSAGTLASVSRGGDDLLGGYPRLGLRAPSVDGDVVHYGCRAVGGAGSVRDCANVVSVAGAVIRPLMVRAATSASPPRLGTAVVATAVPTGMAPM